MHASAFPSMFALALLLAGCASTGSAATGSVALGPGGRAEGRVVVPAGAATTLRLANAGPGLADFVVRVAGRVTMQEGALDTVEMKFTPIEKMTLLVVLEAHADAGTTVMYGLDGAGGASIAWDLARAGR